MFTYAFLKGVRLGILPERFKAVGEKAYQGLLRTFVTENEDSTLNLNQSCRSAGLGPAKSPARDGSADYYLCGEDVWIVNNEGKAVGPFIMASLEYEKANLPQNK
jgi:unsaturated rhamnogalacturonyl hydrolase